MSNVKLMQGDCLQLMKDIPDKSIDMILCDPPYGTTKNAWDKKLDLDRLFTEYNRISKSGGVQVLFSQLPFTADLVNANRKRFRYEWIWQKNNVTGFLNANRMPLKAHENILVFYDRLPEYHPQKRRGFKPYRTKRGHDSTNYGKQVETETNNTDGSRYPIDVLQFDTVHGSMREHSHPTQKPVPLLEYLIKTYSSEGCTVLDSCMGSGSTGVACVNTSRDFIGIELDEDYFQIAKERIRRAEL